MEMKEVYEKLEQMEGGAELITAIKSEVSKLNGEAKTNRENGDKSAAKIKAILENLGLEDGDDVLEKAKEVKSTLDTFRQGNKAPSEVAKQITDLTKQVASVTKQLTEMTKTAEDEKSKRYDAMKESALVDELTKGKAAAPREMAALIKGNLSIGENDEILYKNGDETLSVADGVKGWLENNKWAVKVDGASGGGASSGFYRCRFATFSHSRPIIRRFAPLATVHRKVASRRRLICGGLRPHL